MYSILIKISFFTMMKSWNVNLSLVKGTCRIVRVKVNGEKSDRGCVICRVLRSLDSPHYYSSHIDYLDSEISSSILKFLDDTKTRLLIKSSHETKVFKSGVYILYKQKWQMQFIIIKCTILNVWKHKSCSNKSLKVHQFRHINL